MTAKNYLTIDFGASNGRGLLGHFDGNTIHMEETYRFTNHLYSMSNTYFWDILELMRHTKQIISVSSTKSQLDGIGIDTWGLDYGLLDANDNLLGNIISYRNSQSKYADAVCQIIPQKELFRRTGTGHLIFNTIYQLYERRVKNDPALAAAKCLLPLPDLLGFFLTGAHSIEYTNALTMMLVNQSTKTWDYGLLKCLNLPTDIFPPIIQPAQQKGVLLPEIQTELSVDAIPLYAVASHDTASAIAAIPAKSSNFVYISSGTWSLIGTECDEPILSDTAYQMDFSNEGSLQGKYRINRNIIGMFLIQQCRNQWNQQGYNLSWDEICAKAAQEKPFVSLIDPNDERFYSPGNVIEKICAYCQETNQPIPQSVGQFARCIYESLALSYQKELGHLQKITGKSFDAIHIVGGGCQNKLLNQFTANATRLPVYAGPVESACIGNALAQAIAQGELNGIEQLREVVQNSESITCFEPKDVMEWSNAADHFAKL